MKRFNWLAFVLVLCALPAALGGEAKLIRYPHYHEGRIAFTYLGDIWTATEKGQNLQRITVHRARDVYPRFSPDGKWIAFSSDRNGNLDVFIVPVEGGTPKQLTFHSADDTVLGWTPDANAVLFASQRSEDFMGKLYTVAINGGLPRSAGADMGVYAAYSPDGKKLAINRKSQAYWRKYYRGAYQSDVTLMDIASKKFKDITDFDGMDTWPMWGRDGYIYMVSDREGSGLTNLWRVSENGGQAERITSLTGGDVRWPAMSADGRVIVFEHDFGLWKLDVSSRQVTPIRIEIAAETQENLTEVRDFNSEVDDYDLAPTGRRMVFSIHGEIFTAPVEEGDLRQITDGPARDKSPQYSPDGQWIAFISDRSGREEIYLIAADGAGEPQKITDLDTLKLAIAWSPDAKHIAFTTSDNKLHKYHLETRQTANLASCRFGNIGSPAWSPDGQWIAYSKPDQTRTGDVYLIPAGGGEEKKVTEESYNDINPQFAPNGRKLYFIRSEGSFATPLSSQIHAITLEKETRDPNEPEESLDSSETADPPGEGGGRRPGAQRSLSKEPAKPANIDWPGLKRRTRAITRMPFAVTSFAVAPDNRTIVFLTSEPAGARTTPVIYSIQENGKRLARLTAGTAPGEEDDEPTPGRFFGGGISQFNFSPNGRTLFFRERSQVYSVSMPASSGGAAGAAGGSGLAAAGGRGSEPARSESARGEGARGESARRRVNFTAKVRIEKPSEWAEMFDDAWRTMKYRFYDPKMHGKDWDAMRAKYQPLVQHVGDRQELLNIVNEMIGELNASHTGAAPGRQGRAGGVSTGYLGLDLEPNPAAGYYRVTHIYEEGPADKDWVKVGAGDYLLAINDKPVKAGDNYWPLLNHRLNRKVEVTFNSKPTAEGAWKTRIEPVAMTAFSQLRYERWVKQRREMVDQQSGGRIGYLHIQAMNQNSLRKFQKELREYRHKEALVIDERWNGGGNIEQELLAILVQRQYQIWQPRGTEPTGRPFAGYFGPKVVLQNWRSSSNAEMFPAGFRALGLGKVIGTPTAGAVIGTGSYSLIDGSTVRTPGVGVFLSDTRQTNMENYGVHPDIRVENTPEDNLAGRDRQLEVGVEVLLKELNQKGPLAKAR